MKEKKAEIHVYGGVMSSGKGSLPSIRENQLRTHLISPSYSYTVSRAIHLHTAIWLSHFHVFAGFKGNLRIKLAGNICNLKWSVQVPFYNVRGL